MNTVTAADLVKWVSSDHIAVVNGWLRDGKGVAVYRNMDLSDQMVGHRHFASCGTETAMFKGEPPIQLPDFPNQINWMYRLEGVYSGPPLVDGDTEEI